MSEEASPRSHFVLVLSDRQEYGGKAGTLLKPEMSGFPPSPHFGGSRRIASGNTASL